MKIPELNEGERYAGVIIGGITCKPTHHLILLPQQPETRLTWDEALTWAASIGVELPTRQESALLYANAEDCHKLPDHHNAFGEAWWIDHDVSAWKCVFSPKDA